MTLKSKVEALAALALCLSGAPALCQTDADLQKACAERGINPCPTAKDMATAKAVLQKAWAGNDPYHASLRATLDKSLGGNNESMSKAYLKAVGNPKPTAEAIRLHNAQVGNPDSWFTFLTGASKLAYCETQQGVANGELTGSAASNHASAREWLRATAGVASPLTTRQLDLMLDWIKGFCTDTEGNPDGCDCAQLTQKTQDWLNKQSPY